MTHLDEGLLQALMDDEMAAHERRGADEHLEGCAPCRDALWEARSRAEAVSVALACLDVEAPTARVGARLRAASAGASPRRTLRPARPRRGMGVPLTALPRAAAVALLVAGGAAAAALPGSPLRTWIAGGDDPVGAMGGEPEGHAATLAAPEVGFFLLPLDGRVDVVVKGLPADAEVTVGVADGPQAGVFAPDGASFRGRSGVLTVVAPGGPVRVELPRDAVSSVSVGGRIVLERSGGVTRAPGPVARRDGETVTFRVP